MFPGGGSNSVTVQISGSSVGLQSAVAQAQGSLSQLGMGMTNLGGVTEETGGRFGSFLLNLASLMYVVQNVASAFQPLIDAIQQAGEEMFNLNVQTERNVYNWRFLYGVSQSQQLAAWSQQFSMQIPYTRQDLMAAITRMGSQGFNVNQVESYLPVIADIASTQGRPGLDLAWATQAVVEAMMGRSMMLKQDLNINPALLEAKYGYDPHNAQATLLPALEQYAKARGEYGAAGQVATNTWWGLWSSFVDRLQNFGLEAGGTDASGNPIKGGMFAEMKGGLGDLSKWMDSHKAQIKELADLIGGVLGGAVHDAKLMFDALVNVMDKTGIGTDIQGTLKNLSKWLDDPSTQKHLEDLAGTVGKLVGGGLQSLGSLFGGIFSGVGSSGLGDLFMQTLKNIGDWLSDPGHQADIKQFGQLLGTAWGTLAKLEGLLVGDILTTLGRFGDALNTLTNGHGALLLKSFLEALSVLGQTAATTIGFLILLLGDLSVVLADALSGNWSQLGADMGKVKDDIGTYFSQIGKIWTDAWNSNVAPVTNSNVNAWIAALADPKKKKAANDAGKAVIGAFIDGIVSRIPDVEQAMMGLLPQHIVPALKNGVSSQMQAVRTEGDKVVEAFIAGMDSKKPGVVTWFERMFPQLFKNVDKHTKESHDKGAQLIEAFLSGMDSKKLGLVTWFEHLFPQIFKNVDKQNKQNGQDFIQNFIDGMKSKQKDLEAAAAKAAAAVAQYFHHSTPAVGPLHGDDQWMDHMVKQFATSLHNGVPLIAAASAQLAGAVAGPLTGGIGGGYGNPGAALGAGGGSSYSTNYGDTTQHNVFYGANAGLVEQIVAREFARRDRSGNLMRRQPGTLSVAGAWGNGRGSY